MKSFMLILGLTLVFSTWSLPNQTAQAAQLQTQVVTMANRTLPRNGVRIPFIQVNLRAIDGPVEINALTVSRTGLSTSEDFGRIWAETDNFQRSNSRRLTNDDQVELTFRSPVVVRPGNNERITIYANLEFAGGGRTAALNLAGIDHTGVEARTPSTPERRVSVRQTPVITQSRSTHNRQQFRISCENQICRLVPRN